MPLRLDPPVSVWETISRRRILTDVEGAARWMIEDWPDKVDKPASYVPALRACLLALEGGASAQAARAAVMGAVSDAGILAEP